MANKIEYKSVIDDSLLTGLIALEKQFVSVNAQITLMANELKKSTEKGGTGYIKNAESITKLNEVLNSKLVIEENTYLLEKQRIELETKQNKLDKDKITLQEKELKLQNNKNKQTKTETEETEDLVTVMNKEVKTLKELQEQNTKLRKIRSTMDLDKQKEQINAINLKLDKNNALIKQNNDLLSKQKINIGNYKSAFDGLKGTLDKVGVSLGITAVAMKSMQEIQKAITNIQEFEVELDALESITGASAESMIFMKEKAIELSNKTGIAAKDIVTSFATIGSKRPELLQNAEALAKFSEQVIIFSQAANIDATEATTALTGTLNQLGLEATEADRVINVLAAGSLEGSGEISYLNEVLEGAGAKLKDLNIPLEKSVAAMELLAPVILSGSEAGTQFEGTLNGLAKAGYGFSTGAFNLEEALLAAKTELDAIQDPADKTTRQIELFGVANTTAALTLMNNVDAIGALETKITGTNTAYDQAKINSDNLTTALDKLKQTYNNLFITAGTNEQGFADQAKELVKLATTFLEAVKNSEDLQNSLENFKGMFQDMFSVFQSIFAVFSDGNDTMSGFSGLLKVVSTTLNIITIPAKLFWTIMSELFKAIKDGVLWLKELVTNSEFLTKAFEFLFRPIQEGIKNLKELGEYFGILSVKTEEATSTNALFGTSVTFANDMLEKYKATLKLTNEELDEFITKAIALVNTKVGFTGIDLLSNKQKAVIDNLILWANENKRIKDTQAEVTEVVENTTDATTELTKTITYSLDDVAKAYKEHYSKSKDFVDEEVELLEGYEDEVTDFSSAVIDLYIAIQEKEAENAEILKEKLEEEKELRRDSYESMISDVADFGENMLSNWMNNTKSQIDLRQSNIDDLQSKIDEEQKLLDEKQAKGIARDTAELSRLKQLQEDEIKLKEEQKTKLKRLLIAQIGLQFVADRAAAISHLLVNSEGNPLNALTFDAAGIAQFIAGLARIAAVFASAKASLNEINAYADGTERVTGAGTERSDSIHAKLSINERVVPAAINRAIGYEISNRDLPTLVAAGRIALNGGFSDENMVAEQRKTNELLKKKSSNYKKIRI